MSDERADGRHLLTIGRLADYAGVTIKAVRVYHDRGLLPEPPRDSSGYRRYGAEHAIQLVKIRTLVEAGVPLARIGELLDAGPERFAAAIDEIDRDLRKRAERIRRTRQRLAQLHGGDRLFVSAEVADYLERLREIGVSERTVLLERDLWIMMHSVAPDQAAAWIADKAAASPIPSSARSTSTTTPRSTGRRTTRACPGWPSGPGAGSAHATTAPAPDHHPIRRPPGWRP